MMSSKIQKSSDDVKGLSGVGGSRQNKSSDRLHKLSSGASSSNLASNKRSKSYSQIMTAGAAGNAGTKKKKKELMEDDDEDGWTSASQKGTPEGSRSPKSGSDDEDDEDEGLVMTSKTKTTPKRAVSNQGGSTPRAKMKELPKMSQEKPNLRREDTQVTMRGFESHQGQSSPAIPAGSASDKSSAMPETVGRSRSQEVKEKEVPTLAIDEQKTPSGSPNRRPPIDRGLSVMSGKTLTQDSARGEQSSPTSIRSRSSIRSRTSLLPRESLGPAAPKLSTHYALVGALGSLQEESQFEKAMNQQVPRRYISDSGGLSSSRSDFTLLHNRKHLDEDRGIEGSARRKSSISNIQHNTIKLPGASPSMADVSFDAVRAENTTMPRSRSTAFDSMRKANSPRNDSTHNGEMDRDRQHRLSTRSLTATDAANLSAKLRMARGESYDDAHATSATKMLANSSSKYFAPTNRNDLASTKALKEYNKPTVSVFVKRLGERKNIEVSVAPGSLFDDNFTRASLGSKKVSSQGKKGQQDDNDNIDGHDEDSDNISNVRYVMDFGLNGPSVQKTATTEALLGTLLDHDEFEATWAPALANAAGLGEGTRRAREAAREGGGLESLHMNGLTSTGGVAVNGPNATPMHFLHGLTNTTDAPFPLDPSDMTTSSAAAVNAPSPVMDGTGEYLDAKNLRAIAMTWTALNTNRSHIVTRRYVDPMRESLERIGRVNSLLGAKTTAGGITSSSISDHHGGNQTPTSGALTPGGNLRWGNSWRNLFSENHTLQEET